MTTSTTSRGLPGSPVGGVLRTQPASASKTTSVRTSTDYTVPPGGIAPPRRDSESQVTIYVRRRWRRWVTLPRLRHCKCPIHPYGFPEEDDDDLAPHTGIEPVSHGRQPRCDT